VKCRPNAVPSIVHTPQWHSHWQLAVPGTSYTILSDNFPGIFPERLFPLDKIWQLALTRTDSWPCPTRGGANFQGDIFPGVTSPGGGVPSAHLLYRHYRLYLLSYVRCITKASVWHTARCVWLVINELFAVFVPQETTANTLSSPRTILTNPHFQCTTTDDIRNVGLLTWKVCGNMVFSMAQKSN